MTPYSYASHKLLVKVVHGWHGMTTYVRLRRDFSIWYSFTRHMIFFAAAQFGLHAKGTITKWKDILQRHRRRNLMLLIAIRALRLAVGKEMV